MLSGRSPESIYTRCSVKSMVSWLSSVHEGSAGAIPELEARSLGILVHSGLHVRLGDVYRWTVSLHGKFVSRHQYRLSSAGNTALFRVFCKRIHDGKATYGSCVFLLLFPYSDYQCLCAVEGVMA